MTASCVAITAARLAPIASSQSTKKLSGSSATPSRDNNSYTTIFRTPYTSNRDGRRRSLQRIVRRQQCHHHVTGSHCYRLPSVSTGGIRNQRFHNLIGVDVAFASVLML